MKNRAQCDVGASRTLDHYGIEANVNGPRHELKAEALFNSIRAAKSAKVKLFTITNDYESFFMKSLSCRVLTCSL